SRPPRPPGTAFRPFPSPGSTRREVRWASRQTPAVARATGTNRSALSGCRTVVKTRSGRPSPREGLCMHGTHTPGSRPEVRLAAVLLTGLLVWLLSAPLSAEQPRTGGALSLIVSAEPPSCEPH